MPIEDAERARKLAKVIVSDIKLYNQAAIAAGNDITEQLDEGRALFRSRVAASLLSSFEVVLEESGLVAASQPAASEPATKSPLMVADAPEPRNRPGAIALAANAKSRQERVRRANVPSERRVAARGNGAAVAPRVNAARPRIPRPMVAPSVAVSHAQGPVAQPVAAVQREHVRAIIAEPKSDIMPAQPALVPSPVVEAMSPPNPVAPRAEEAASAPFVPREVKAMPPPMPVVSVKAAPAPTVSRATDAAVPVHVASEATEVPRGAPMAVPVARDGRRAPPMLPGSGLGRASASGSAVVTQNMLAAPLHVPVQEGALAVAAAEPSPLPARPEVPADRSGLRLAAPSDEPDRPSVGLLAEAELSAPGPSSEPALPMRKVSHGTYLVVALLLAALAGAVWWFTR